MKGRIFKILVISGLLTIAGCISIPGSEFTVYSQDKASYFCPPCGCSLDKERFEDPGKCPHCQMPLLKTASGLKQTLRATFAPMFRHADLYGDYYVRLIYPLILVHAFLVILLLVTSRFSINAILLATFFLSMSLYILKFQLYGTNYAFNVSRSTLSFPIAFMALTWPALFLYVQSLSGKQAFQLRKEWLHFVPAALLWIVQLVFFFGYPWSEKFLYNHFDFFINPVEQIIFIAGGFFYLPGIMSNTRPNPVAQQGGPEPTWIRKLLIFPVVLVVVMLFLVVINGWLFGFMVSTLDYHLLWFVMTLSLIWYSAMIWVRRDQLIKLEIPAKPRVPAEKLEGFKKQAERVMEEEKPFLDANFSLPDFAKLVGVTPKEMTEIIKVGFGSNFYDFVNQYRVDLVKEHLINPELSHFTNFALGEMAGFRSKNTFLSYFKKYVGMTPKVYRQSVKLGQEQGK